MCHGQISLIRKQRIGLYNSGMIAKGVFAMPRFSYGKRSTKTWFATVFLAVSAALALVANMISYANTSNLVHRHGPLAYYGQN